MIVIGTDRQGTTHAVDDTGLKKGCGANIAVCGQEAFLSSGSLEMQRSLIQCVRCLHGIDGGLHLVKEKLIAQRKKNAETST